MAKFYRRLAEPLSIVVVPDSGTGELEGLAGRMEIDFSESGHSYRFDYTLSSRES